MEKVNYQPGDKVTIIYRLHGHKMPLYIDVILKEYYIDTSDVKGFLVEYNEQTWFVSPEEIKPYEPKKGQKKVAIMQGVVPYDPDIMQKTSDKIEEENLITQRGFGSKYKILETSENCNLLDKHYSAIGPLKSIKYETDSRRRWYFNELNERATEITTAQFREHILGEKPEGATKEQLTSWLASANRLLIERAKKIKTLRRDLEQCELKLKNAYLQAQNDCLTERNEKLHVQHLTDLKVFKHLEYLTNEQDSLIKPLNSLTSKQLEIIKGHSIK